MKGTTRPNVRKIGILFCVSPYLNLWLYNYHSVLSLRIPIRHTPRTFSCFTGLSAPNSCPCALCQFSILLGQSPVQTLVVCSSNVLCVYSALFGFFFSSPLTNEIMDLPSANIKTLWSLDLSPIFFHATGNLSTSSR